MKKLSDQDAPKFIVVKAGDKKIIYEQLEIKYTTENKKTKK